MTTPYDEANAELLATIQRLRSDLGQEAVCDDAITTVALYDGLCKLERELRRELAWQGAMAKEQAA